MLKRYINWIQKKVSGAGNNRPRCEVCGATDILMGDSCDKYYCPTCYEIVHH